MIDIKERYGLNYNQRRESLMRISPIDRKILRRALSMNKAEKKQAANAYTRHVEEERIRLGLVGVNNA